MASTPSIRTQACVLSIGAAMGWATGAILPTRAAELHVRWTAANAPLVHGVTRIVHSAGQVVSFTRTDVLLSAIALHRPGVGWITQSNWVGVFQGNSTTGVVLAGLPPGSYDRIRIDVGLPPALNQRDASEWPPEHPLNPAISGLHWGWSGGWVFAAIEGHWSEPAGSKRGFSLHLATDALRRTIERPLAFNAAGANDIEWVFDVARWMGGTTPQFDRTNATTHSRAGDPLAARWMALLVDSAEVRVTPHRTHPGDSRVTSMAPETAPDAQPYQLVIPVSFPRPSLPTNNPLTVEGVALGRRLFSEPLLSRDEKQSCASCHSPDRAFTDGSPVSVGVTGRPGTRSAMPLFNLAWKSAFFWDGRARTLREQVLQPIAHPDEMAESIPNVLEKLRTHTGSDSYPHAFKRAFGTTEISAARLARALEQFLLVQVSGNSRFDRAARGEITLTAQEARGFDLFRTENDPSRGLQGADCFHCHGGALFQSQRFGNNGLSTTFTDRGRGDVTGRASDTGLFSVPSLRNVALTAPYMHDGRFQTLEEVVAHYCTGIQPSPTLDPNLAKHREGGLRLDPEDQQALVAFLHTLTDVPTR